MNREMPEWFLQFVKYEMQRIREAKQERDWAEMANAEATKQVVIAEVVRHEGAGISIPDGVSIPDAIKSLQQQMEYEEKDVNIVEAMPVLPYDGANILHGVLADFYGKGAMGVAKPGSWFEPEQPPSIVSVQSGPGTMDVVQVPWGNFKLVGISGIVNTHYVWSGESYVSQLIGKIKRKDEKKLRSIFAEVRSRITTHSIYRGKAIRIKFREPDGDRLTEPQISFIDTESVRDEDMVFSAGVLAQIETSIFTPIESSGALRMMGVPPKRGVLLHGVYGTGKTLAAYGAAARAVKAGMTFLYLSDASELPDAMAFAKIYGPCVIFAEDIDRHTDGEERSEVINAILNCLDGVDTKGAELLVVFTTNHVEKINSAMMRPGRLDAVIHVTPPDAQAAAKLVANYSRGMLAPDVDMERVGKHFDGMIPAVIREAVERAKLFAVNSLVRSGIVLQSRKDVLISTDDLVLAANQVRAQTEFTQRAVKQLSPGDQIASGIARVLLNGDESVEMEELVEV